MKKILLLILLFSLSLQASAQEVMYEVFIRSYYDSNGDGHGDLKGVEQKLDELYKLGVTSIVLSPIYQSPFYHNYYADNFEEVDTTYGTWDDYKSLIKAVHLRKMKIYQDIHLNYISGKHTWYETSYGKPKSPNADFVYYTDKQNKMPLFLDGMEQHTAYKGVTDQVVAVNLNNPKVQKYFLEKLSHLIYINQDAMGKDGIDGFRFIGMGNEKATGDNQLTKFWKPLTEGLKKVNPKLEIIALQSGENNYGTDCFANGNADRVYANPLREAMATLDKNKIIAAADSTFAPTPVGKQQIVFLEDPQTDRFASIEGMNLSELKVAAALNFLIGGVPSLYYGQEIGTHGKQIEISAEGERIPVRQSYKWYPGATGTGMASWYLNNAPWEEKEEIINNGFSSQEQQATSNSLLDFYKEMIQLRRRQPAIGLGNYKNVSNASDNVISFTREGGNQKILIMINLSDSQQVVTITDTTLSLQKLQVIIGSDNYKFHRGGSTLVLPPYWIQVWKLL